MRKRYPAWLVTGVLALLCVPSFAVAQDARGAAPPAQGRGGGRGPQAPAVVSPEVMSDRRVTFRIYAPSADAVRLGAGDIPGLGQATQLTKAENGVWELTIGPLDPGAYRYNFNVDGVTTIDPRNPATSESNNNVWSLVRRPRLRLHGHEARAARRGRRGHVLFDGAEHVPPHAGLHAARVRIGQRQVSRVLPPARRRGQRRRLADGGPRGLHPRQPHRGRESEADDRRDAGRAHETNDGRGEGASSPDAPRTKSS